VDIFVKDMGLVEAAADEVGARVPMAKAAATLYNDASAAGLGRKDDSVLISVIRGDG
jgi:3-hydroxyisobutyrate dehydrogenase-like beta-hydroxyacid dehydrogenase